MIRGVRGATTVTKNEAQEIEQATEALVREMVSENALQPEQIAQVIVTATNDIDATFPAKAVRHLQGWQYVPVMCAQEIPVKGSLPLCIRVMMTVNTSLKQEEIKHVFLEGAIVLRPDLLKK